MYSVFIEIIFMLILVNDRNSHNTRKSQLYLGSSERTSFVNVVLKLIDRGQYSKNEHLSETVAAATSILSYVDPSSVLPFLASRFHMALETVSMVACITLMLKLLTSNIICTGNLHFFKVGILSSH